MTGPLPPTAPSKQTTLAGGSLDIDDVSDTKELLDKGTPEIMYELYTIARNVSGDVSTGQQLKAIELFLDRAMGKAAQHVEMSHNTNDILQLITQGADPTVALPEPIDAEEITEEDT